MEFHFRTYGCHPLSEEKYVISHKMGLLYVTYGVLLWWPLIEQDPNIEVMSSNVKVQSHDKNNIPSSGSACPSPL